MCVACVHRNYSEDIVLYKLSFLSLPPDSITQLLPGQEQYECIRTPRLSGQTGQVAPLKGQEETEASHTLPERKHSQLCVSVMDDNVFCLFVSMPEMATPTHLK